MAVGGRILDSSAILAFVAGAPYPSAVVWHAIAQNMVLAIPSAALAEAWAHARPGDRDVLEVLLRLPVVIVVDDAGVVACPPVPVRVGAGARGRARGAPGPGAAGLGDRDRPGGGAAGARPGCRGG
jgi:hypothetical protein